MTLGIEMLTIWNNPYVRGKDPRAPTYSWGAIANSWLLRNGQLSQWLTPHPKVQGTFELGRLQGGKKKEDIKLEGNVGWILKELEEGIWSKFMHKILIINRIFHLIFKDMKNNNLYMTENELNAFFLIILKPAKKKFEQFYSKIII